MNALRTPVTHCALSIPLLLCAGAALAAPERFEGAVTDADDLAPFFEGAATRRVDVVGIGDSNQLFQGHGWDAAWILATDARFGAWATSLLSPGENNGNGGSSGQGWSAAATSSTNQFGYTNAPPAQNDLLADTPDFGPLNYLHVPEGDQATLTTHGIRLETAAPLDVNASLDFVTVHAIANSASPATFRPFVRRGDSPFNGVAIVPDPILLTGPTDTVATTTLAIPAGVRDHPLEARLGPFNATLDGPLTAYYMRFIGADITRGVACSTLYGVGSRSARDMARALTALPEDTLTLYFDTLRAQQAGTPRILVRINTGLNDLSETEPPPSAPGLSPTSADAYEINCNAIIDRIASIWTLNGWDEEELFFLLTPPHPTGPLSGGSAGANNDDTRLIAYRERARNIALQRPRCAAVDFNAIITEPEMVDLVYYVFFFDRFHLRTTGYRALSTSELAALQNGRSWYDANADGTIDTEDLYTLEQWGVAPTDAPADLSTEGLRRAVRFGEIDDATP